MDNYIVIGGKKIGLSQETISNIKSQIMPEATPSDKISSKYNLMQNINWNTQGKVLVNDAQDKRIYVNQHFDDNCRFGNNCIFIKCKLGSDCKFGSSCNFGSWCNFGLNCEFGASCNFGSWCNFGSNCNFGVGCEFGSSCEFGAGCIKY